VLRKSGVALAPGAVVTYAHSCWFRGQFVPHLVVQSASGPVTVMILPGEQVATRERFNEVPYSGVIAPIDGGSVAVLTRGQGGDLDAVLDSVLAALKAPAAG
jgi:glucose/arabinose dehydrogenase